MAAFFDQKVIGIISSWTDVAIDPTSIHAKIAQLPCKLGGCGFTLLEALRNVAFVASRDAALRRLPYHVPLGTAATPQSVVI